ncbi:hypothetical protein AB6A40_006778 [Gnathostoma spinigerum]|uniref:Flavodoxin-like domain-containing protein n=1 Tax=Gnathostoma spinigerum TaxID=75299 RepID=A0ABD6EJC7_9BILA
MSRYITGFLFGNFSANSPAHLVEKDDVLLYMTAFIGVVMPGCIYVLYHNIYQIYCRYAERKAKEASYELSLCTAITIFHASNGEIGKRLAIVLARKLEAAAPSVVDIANLNISYFSHYKGIGLFIIVTGQGGREPENVEWFFDWLEDIALSSSPKTQLECRNMHFAVLGINEAYEANRYNRVCYQNNF